MTALLTDHHFFGTSKVFGKETDALTAIMRGMAQFQAKLAASAVNALTDSSGGTANGTMQAIANVTPASLGTTDCAQKAAAETAFGTVRDALSEIIAQANAIRAKVPAFGALTDNTGGATADGTVGAVTQSLTGVGASMAAAAGVNSFLSALRIELDQAQYYVNALARATGTTEIAGSVGLKSTENRTFSTAFAALSTSTGTTGTGTNDVVKVTEMNTVLATIANNITELTTTLQAVVAHATGYLVAPVIAA